jgi:lipopolysaccharide transport system ATP-binding protein
MSEIVVRADNLGKLYRIRRREPYYTLRDSIAHAFTFRWLRNGRQSGAADNLSPAISHSGSANGDSQSEFIWALKDVGFEVRRGEVVGIIGRNGAGKSTLLKILSGITEPTEGFAQIRGRVGSLLEVGTGFHPELTGRENIYLNGAILGMKKAEISRKFDEIVAFAEIEKFLDTPVKHYSSGMYMRLAFSVAAHLEPEILLVDEVLAVGDAAFQKKCLGKMENVAKEGRTVLFVSHNMGAVKTLCSRCLLLANGQLLSDDLPSTVIGFYLSDLYAGNSSQIVLPNRPGVLIQVTKIWFEEVDGNQISEIEMGRNVCLGINYTITKTLRDVTVAALISKEGMPLLYTYDTDGKEILKDTRIAGRYRCRVHLPMSLFKEGTYTVSVLIGYGKENLTDPDACIRLDIVNRALDLTHRSYRVDRPGLLFREIQWDTELYASE